jgi:hypothetical protein
MADQPGRVGVLDQAGGVADDAGDADTDGAGAPGFGFELGDEAGDGIEGGAVVARGGDAAAGGDDRACVQRDAFDLGAAEVDADLH